MPSFHITEEGTFTLQSAGGATLQSITVNTAGDGATITVYDSPTDSGTELAVITPSAPVPLFYGTVLAKGLTIVVATAACDITVVLGTGAVINVTQGGGSIAEITSDDDSVTITDPEGPVTDLSVGSVAGVQLVQKGPFKFTFEDYAELLTGVLLWNAAAGDSPQFIMISVPVTPFDGGTGASVTADSAPTLPLTIVTGVNDTFVYTGDGGSGTPETFTMANAAVATTLAELEAIVEAALGSVSGEPFSTYVAVTDNGTNLVFTMKTVGVAASAQNSNTITEGDGGAAAIGIEAPPATFENGVGPILNVTLGDLPIAPNVSDVSMVDAPNPGYGNLQSVGGVPILPGDGAVYISAAQAGLPYNALFASDPGALTQGECYVYGLLYPELIQTT